MWNRAVGGGEGRDLFFCEGEGGAPKKTVSSSAGEGSALTGPAL